MIPGDDGTSRFRAAQFPVNWRFLLPSFDVVNTGKHRNWFDARAEASVISNTDPNDFIAWTVQ